MSDRITSLADQKNPVDVVYLDFRKASDVVPHDVLVVKLVRCGLDTVFKMFLSTN